jgi:hypothetical protein
MTLPKLRQLFAPDFLIDFVENIRQFKALRAVLKQKSEEAVPDLAAG